VCDVGISVDGREVGTAQQPLLPCQGEIGVRPLVSDAHIWESIIESQCTVWFVGGQTAEYRDLDAASDGRLRYFGETLAAPLGASLLRFLTAIIEIARISDSPSTGCTTTHELDPPPDNAACATSRITQSGAAAPGWTPSPWREAGNRPCLSRRRVLATG